jgi:hypothetical protein
VGRPLIKMRQLPVNGGATVVATLAMLKPTAAEDPHCQRVPSGEGRYGAPA